MDGLDAPSFVELDPPTTRGRSSSDEKTLAVAVFWMARSPPALIRTRSPGASDCFDSVSVFVAEPMPLHSFTLHHHAGKTPMEVGRQLCELPSLSLFGGVE